MYLEIHCCIYRDLGSVLGITDVWMKSLGREFKVETIKERPHLGMHLQFAMKWNRSYVNWETTVGERGRRIDS